MQRTKQRGFTLIELLVVIAIIAILAAILFPVFAQAKRAAKGSVAVSNAKQMALGQIMYSNDYDDMFSPAVEYPQSSGAMYPWSFLQQPYMKSWAFCKTQRDRMFCSTRAIPAEGTTHSLCTAFGE